MHIDKDAAELLAQVIPALLIVLVLEGRLARPQGTPTIWRKTHAMVRNFTVFTSLSAEFACLIIVMSDVNPTPFIDTAIVIAVSLLMVSIYLMFVPLISSELRDNL